MTKEKKYMIIGIFILMITLVGSVGTYAWFTWKSTNNTSLTMTIGKLADVIFTSGNNISTSTLSPVYNYTDGEVTTFSINNKDTTGSTVDYAVKLNITSIATELKSTSLKYVLLKNNTIVQEGDFSTISTGSTTIYSDSISTSGITNYKFYLYIDGNIENNTSMINKTLSGTLTVTEITDTYELTNGDGTTYTPSYNGSGTKIARSNAPLNKFKEVRVDNAVVDSSNYTLTEGSTIITFKETYLKTLSEGEHILKIISTDGFTSGKIIIKKPVTVAQMITNLYNNAAKTTTTVNSVTYNLASSVGLMNDRKGSMSTGINAGNIRYYGASPNNYIYFNCSDYSNQSSSTCETWRIIGMFDDKVKIMRGSMIGSYSWDRRDVDGYAGYNNWSDADLMKLLNSGYESESVGGSLYWNAKSGACYKDAPEETIACDFTSIGLKNDTTKNMISETTYYMRGHNSEMVYVETMYDKERVSGKLFDNTQSTTWTGKIAVPYSSDYGYAVDLSKCKKQLNSYDDEICTANNWMESIMTLNWLLTPYSDDGNSAWVVDLNGDVGAGMCAANAIGITPVLYLNSKLTIKSGTGSSSTPYQLSLS
ncbi:MAG: hypothetical protein UCL21_01000 [Bacilli bacterium]|nr:hypothetical protein [Bacilli bacterium]